MFQLPLSLDNGIIVLRKYLYTHKFAQLTTGVLTEVTQCKFEGNLFYIREAFNGIPSFLQHSNHRMAIKTVHIEAELQVLELCCPDQLFERLSCMITAFDHLHRPVRKNSKFTYKWAMRKDNKQLLY